MKGIWKYCSRGKCIPGMVLPFLFILLFTTSSSAQVNIEIGELKIENFSPKQYKSHPQNWAIAQGLDGIMYFGNNMGVLAYDGVNWDLIKTSNESTVRSLDISPKGMVFVGASGDFGYLEADEHGIYKYHSLSRLYNLNENKVGDIEGVAAFDQGVYFLSKNGIYFYNGLTLRLWEGDDYQSGWKIDASFVLNRLNFGLCRMIDDTLNRMSRVSDFKYQRIYDIVDFTSREKLVLTERNGFQYYSASNWEQDFIKRLNENTSYFNPYNAAMIRPDVLSVGTWGNGLLLVDKDGDVVQHVNAASGLIDEVITDQLIDADGNLWLTTSNGISKVTINENLAAFGSGVNVDETVEDIVEHNGTIYIATHTGLYKWHEKDKQGRFKRVANITSECWDILPFEQAGRSLLLVAGNNAVYQVDENENLDMVVSCMPWTFHQMQDDPSTIFIGLDDGLMCMRYEKDGWRIADKIEGISNTIYCIAQSEKKRLWLGTLNHGVIRVDMNERITHYPYQFNVRKFGMEDGLPEGGVFVSEYVGGILFGTTNGFYEYRPDKNQFVEEELYKEKMGMEDMVIHRISEDENGNLWTVAYWEDDFSIGYFERKRGEVAWHGDAFKPIASEVFHAIWHGKDGATWLGGPEGLFRYDLKGQKGVSREFSAQIRDVYLNKDSLEYAGYSKVLNYGDSSLNASLHRTYAHSFNSLSFVFGSEYQKHDAQNLYSYRLLGFDEKWSEWSKENKAVYTNLYEGSYSFQVRTMNAYGQEGSLDEYQFHVLPPWYRTWWAFVIYGLLSAALIYFIVVFYTRKLKQIIRERTREVVRQKEEIEKQKEEVEEQRKLLEVKNKDITSSINYARRLQEAILPNKDQIDKYLEEYFILYKPKDIVSGDFYWMEHVNGIPGRDLTLFATVDCTGHGVPGAFVSVVGNGGLNRAVNEFGLDEPAAILEKLNEIVVNTLSKSDDELRDGMDISLCRFDFKAMEMQFAGANNSVYILRKDIAKAELSLNGTSKIHKNDLLEIKANKQPVGFYEFHKTFNNHTVKLEKGDVIYLFSDGYTDQFGGPQGKKYNVTRFRNFLLSIYDRPMSEQKKLIEEEFENWKGNEEQIDDVIVAGIRV